MGMKRVADILVDELVKGGLEQVFMITGGGAMHLNDAFGRRKELRITFNHHEQACAIAAEGYARLAGQPAIVNVTTGPGGINALTGVYGAYTDSIPMVVVSGQIKRDTMQRNFAPALRQLGDQEVDILPMARPVVKYAVEAQNPYRIREATAKALYLARHGRPGPVWIDVPIDIQSMRIDEDRLVPWNPDDPLCLKELRGDPDLSRNTLADFTLAAAPEMRRKAAAIVERLARSRRPVILGGTGVHLAGMAERFRALGEKLGLPLVGGWNAYDLVPNDHPCHAGRPGTVGDRPGNFTVQNADFLLTLGCRLNIRQISYNWESFARRAWKAQVDIDGEELRKPTLDNDLVLQADLRDFLPVLEEALADWRPRPEHAAYRDWCRERVLRYPALPPAHKSSPAVNPYYFMDALFARLEPGDVVVAANATAAVVGGQAGVLKEGVRMFSNSGAASMGYDLPAALGAALSGRARRVVCLAGDGSAMMNLQELQTIVGQRIPVIVYLLNNRGYLSIRTSQALYFPDNPTGAGPESGVSFPDFPALARAFGLPGGRLASHAELDANLSDTLSGPAPALYEVMLDPEQGFEPKLASRVLPDGTMVSPELDDMAPFLPEAERAGNRLD